MNKIQKLRMRRLIKMLNNLKSELPKTRLPDNVEAHLKKFDMAVWHCGTSACALGAAACHPYFQKHGLTLSGNDFWGPTDFIPSFDGKQGFDAAEAFFGITKDEAADIFSHSSGRSNTAKAVAKRAQAVLDSHK